MRPGDVALAGVCAVVAPRPPLLRWPCQVELFIGVGLVWYVRMRYRA